MNAISQNHADFAARVGRIEKRTASATQLLYVGMDEVYEMPKRERKVRATGLGGLISNALYPLSMVAAVALGAVSHTMGQVLRYHVQGMPDAKANPDIEMVVQIILGVTIAIVLGYFIGLRSSKYTLLKTLGVVAGMLAMHNAVHAAPWLFKAVTSPLWVNGIVSQTHPNSIVWRGISFML